MNKNIVFSIKKHYQKIFSIIFILILIINTLYSFDYKTWIWTGEISTWKKIIGISVSLSAILGVLSVIFFALHKNIAYLLGISNAILYALFAFSWGLAIDGFINFIIYIPIMLATWYKTTRIKNQNKLFESFRSNIYSTSFFIILTICLTVIFYYSNPEVNKLVVKLLGEEKVERYGSNFNYFIAGNILISLINALSVVALTMMVMGFRDSWIIWIIKNIFSFIFFGGIGFINITTLLINIIYMILSIHLFFITTNKKTISVAFSGWYGINDFKDFFDKNGFTVFKPELVNTNINNLRIYRNLLSELLKIVKKSQFNDRIIFNYYLLDAILLLDKIEINNFSDKIKVIFLKNKYKISLAMQKKLDIMFVWSSSKNYLSYKNKRFWNSFFKEVLYLDETDINNIIINKLSELLQEEQLTNFKKIFSRNKQ